MIRGELANSLDHDPDFRWRGESVTRVENLSDIVFALALGMIIFPASIPESYDELIRYLMTIIPATASFAVLVSIWHDHFTFFRRYGLADRRIMFLNVVLLFVVLFIAFPLRFVFDSLFAFFMMAVNGNFELAERIGMDFERSGQILALFGLGFMIVHLLFLMMHRHVLKKQTLLDLAASETVMTQRSTFFHLWTALLSALTAALAYFTFLNGFAGFILCATWILDPLAKRRYRLPKS